MAQKAQLAPQLAAAAPVPMDPYQQYLQYQMYQQMEMAPQAAVPYSPFGVYGPIYRGQAPVAAPPFQAARPAPIQYHPMAYYHHPQAGQPPIRKKSAMT
ncbi:hypothetical protein B9Z55_016594 [Caenorhabditis nigoni]|nr:hypothetical protein B9Z55_016594 [Caenorhabditis nigoni]